MKNNESKNIFSLISKTFISKAIWGYVILGIVGIANLVISHQKGSAYGTMLILSLCETAVIICALIVIAIKENGIMAHKISESIDQLASAADQIAIGNLDIVLPVSNLEETDRLADSMKRIVTSIDNMETDFDVLTDRIENGQLGATLDLNRHNGSYRKIAENTSRITKTFKDPLDTFATFIHNMANGIRQQDITCEYKGDFAKFADNMNDVRHSLIILLSEAKKLEDAGRNGALEVRGDDSKLKGYYSEIIDGFNDMFERIAEPINEANVVLKKIAVNDYSSQMQGDYKGSFSELQDSINSVMGTLLRIQDLFEKLSKGDISMYENYNKIGRRSENDKMVPAGVIMMRTLMDMIAETEKLASAATAGDLNQKGDADKFQGGYKQVIDGFNRLIEAVVAPLKETSQILQKLAHSDMTAEMTGNYQGEYNNMKTAMNQAVSSFNEVLGQINIAASQVSASSAQVSAASQSLAQGATEQASSVEELSSAITEVAAQVRENADNAQKAKDISDKAIDSARRGNEQMKLMLNSMNEINEGSANISKIIKVIDEIAFQTNILALNAAVEAARAGQAGKGFAVVAEEVRNLAARSADAAKETTTLIEGNIGKVEAGTKIANITASELDEIVNGIRETASYINNIADASEQQSTAVSQIDTGIEQVSTIVQTNSATAEESAASSEELSGQAVSLKQLVDQFKLKNYNAQGDSNQSNGNQNKYTNNILESA